MLAFANTNDAVLWSLLVSRSAMLPFTIIAEARFSDFACTLKFECSWHWISHHVVSPSLCLRQGSQAVEPVDEHLG